MNNTKKKIVLGLSGGVDSAVSAHMLKAQGFTVYGVFLSQHGSSSEAAVSQAAQLGIPLSIKDITPRLEREVCAAFSAAYISGRTPNPCILCNPSVKFPALAEEADALGAYHVATGHYAAAELGSDGWTYLKKGRPENDQSYMLCRLPQEILRRVVFPLSGYRKEEARAYASQHGLLSAKTPDSMEICFIPDGDYAAWLERRGIVSAPGDFIDEAGNLLGRHEGLSHYTVGMRRGLGVWAGERLYVKAIIPDTNRIVLATLNDMYTNQVRLKDILRLSPALPDSFRADVRVRHSRSSYPATARFTADDGLDIIFDDPIRIPASGQLAALYLGDILACSGEIQ